MCEEELTFLRAAAANPEDDTLRLAYADWLDEQGGKTQAKHAALVRLQVQRSRLEIFDPARSSLLEEEGKYLQKYKRDLNGRVHYSLHKKGLRNLVDSRRGMIRGWNYHRGMIAKVSVSAIGLATHPELIFSLGPVEAIHIVNWSIGGWGQAAGTLQGLLPRLKLVTVAGEHFYPPLRNLYQYESIDRIPLLDLRSNRCGEHVDELFYQARSGTISPVVLFQRGTPVERSYSRDGRQFVAREWNEVDYVIDPFHQWERLRFWFADFTGEVLSPVRYQVTSP